MSGDRGNKAGRMVAWIPNGVTSLSLVCGFVAIVLSGDLMSPGAFGLSRLELCWILIGSAAVFDFLDGLTARLLHATSAIGKELDSLCDLVSFGVAPAVMLYHVIRVFRLEWGEWIAWMSVMIAVCGALRLAKFNVDTRQTSSFIGLPIPANAIFWIGYMAFLASSDLAGELLSVAVIAVVSLLMVSELPMFSFKIKGGFKMDMPNISRIALIISAILLVIFWGVEGFMWTIAVYVSLSIINVLCRASADTAKK